jgi:hypothetical protein
MLVFLLTVLVFGLVIAGMAVGVMAGREPIKGSCGGIGALGLGQVCEICGNDPARCEVEEQSDGAAGGGGRFYDASKS